MCILLYYRANKMMMMMMFDPLPFLLFFPCPVKFSKEVWGSTVSFAQSRARKRHPVAAVEGDQMQFVPVTSKVGGDTSRGP